MTNRFNYAKKGYDTTEVDSYIASLETVIKSYKEKDTAIKNAILNAQIAADSIILNAKGEAKEIKKNALKQIEEIKDSVSTQKDMLQIFHQEYNDMLKKYMQTITNNDINSVKSKINDLEKFLNKFADVKNSGEINSKSDKLARKISDEEKKELFG